MASLNLRNINKRYEETEVIRSVNLDIADGEFVVFVGPSGCGKSTLMRMIAGLEDITGGDLTIDGVRVNDVQPAKRGIAMVFQSYALYPHMTLYDNMAFGLKLAGTKKPEIDAAIDAMIAQNPKSLQDYKGGKASALGALVGMIMKSGKGFNAKLVQEALKKKLG